MSSLGALARLVRLSRRTRWSQERLAALRLRKLQTLIAHAYSQVPHYRRLFDAHGVAPQDIRRLEDLERIPVTRRRDLLGMPLEDRLAGDADVERLIHHHTSGSTGVQLEICYSPEEHENHALLTLRSELEVGATALGHLTQVCRTVYPPQPHWYQRLGLLRRSFIDPWAPYEEQIERIRALEPGVLVGYPFHLRLLAAKARSMGVEDVRVPFIFTSSERLTAEARDLISTVFKSEVFERYDAWEGYLLAWECGQHDGLHIEHDHVVLECLDGEGRPTKGRGEMVVTNLDLYSTPMIRYALDDVVTIAHGACPCGSTFPRLAGIEGRKADTFRLPGGRLLSPMVFPDLAGVLQYRAVQESVNSVRLELVPATGLDDAAMGRIQRDFEELMGPEVRIRLMVVDDIPLAAGGKHRYLISEVASDVESLGTD